MIRSRHLNLIHFRQYFFHLPQLLEILVYFGAGAADLTRQGLDDGLDFEFEFICL